MANVRSYKKLLVFSDVHVPKQNDRVVELLKAVRRHEKPDYVVSAGDFLDVSNVTSFPSDPDLFTQANEFEMANDLLDDLKITHFIQANHEERLERPSLVPFAIRNLIHPAKWLHLKERKVKWVPYSTHPKKVLKFGNLTVVHGHSAAQNAVKRAAERYGNVIFGHTHRVAMITLPHLSHEVAAYNIGCCCNLRASYIEKSDPVGWRSGFMLVHLYRSGRFSAHQVLADGRITHVNGKEYRF